MKVSIRHHLLFWALYMGWDILQAVITFGKENQLSPELSMALYSTLLGTVPKIILSYYLIYFVLQPAIRAKRLSIGNLAKLLISTGLVLLLHRTLMYYIIVRKVYHINNSRMKFFNVPSFTVTFADLILPVVALLAFHLFLSNLSSRNRESKLEREKLQSELNFLKAQINPHFLFNVLSTIHALTRIKAPEAATVTVKLSKMMRFMLFEARSSQIRIQQELSLIEDFIELEGIRYQNKLDIEFTKELDDDSSMITPLILLPFVENAFKHGVADSRYGSYIRIKVVLKAGLLEFEVVNSLEQSPDTQSKNGIGLANVKRQLELLYPHHILTIQTRNSEFFVSLKLNLSEDDKTFLSGN